MTAPLPHATPSSSYTTGLPTPPRILIPPPHPTPPISDPNLPPSVQDWKYESRRQAQQILPHLFLGPLSSARDVRFLQENGITHLLAIRSGMSPYSTVLSRSPVNVEGVRFDSMELTRDAVIAGMQRAHGLIDAHYLSTLPEAVRNVLRTPLDAESVEEVRRRWKEETGAAMPEGGKTLVFCESGNERSAVVVAGYVMQHLGEGAVGGIQWVQGRRFCVCFDDGMKWILRGWEPIWLARRQASAARITNGRGVASSQTGANGQAQANTKRRYVEDDEDSSGQGQGQGRSEGRADARAPFADEEEDEGLMDMMA